MKEFNCCNNNIQESQFLKLYHINNFFSKKFYYYNKRKITCKRQHSMMINHVARSKSYTQKNIYKVYNDNESIYMQHVITHINIENY